MSNNAPVNVKLETPTIVLRGWEDETQKWLALNRDVGGNADFYPLTVKAAYVVGVIHSLCQSVSILLSDEKAKLVSYIPAYGVFASGVELLGRCVRGNTGTVGSVDDLTTGFRWMASSFFDDYKDDYKSVPLGIIQVQTENYMYSISNLVALRHFSAHGQATSREVVEGGYEFGYIDYELLSHMPRLLANGIEKYWNDLQTEENLCNKLAAANVIALRNWPIFLSWSLFEADERGVYNSITEIFNRFDWSV